MLPFRGSYVLEMQIEQIFQACLLAIAQATSLEVDWRLSEKNDNGHLFVGHLETDIGRATIVDSASNGPRSCTVWGIDPYGEDAQVEITWASVKERALMWEEDYAAHANILDLRNDGHYESLFLFSSDVAVAQFHFAAYDLDREIESNVPRFAPGGALLFYVADARGLPVAR